MSSSESPAGASNGTLCVVGLGYIGLPTAVVFANSGWSVLGVDVAERIVSMVNAATLPFVEAGLEEVLAEVVANGSLRAVGAPESAGVFVISVPTPFGPDHEADLRFVDSAADSVASVLCGGELVVLESTVSPGATEHLARRILDARPDLAGDDTWEGAKLSFAHAPERVLPGRIMAELTTNDRIIGGLTPAATERARGVYQTFCTGTISTTDSRTAELSKLAENSFRDVNIAFANELSLVCADLGIDVWELIGLANHHPRVNILQPGPGVGGHCIAIDPWFIVAADPDRARLIRTAREVNDSKPDWVIDRIETAMTQPAVGGSPVALLGLAFKPDIDDLRSSPALEIAARVAADNPNTRFLAVEPNISELPTALSALDNVTLTSFDDAVEQSRVVALLVDHTPFREVDPATLGTRIIVDTRGIWVGGTGE